MRNATYRLKPSLEALAKIVSLVPGARFWFSLLSKLSILRATCPKPTAARS